jgi:hypothetical protein
VRRPAAVLLAVVLTTAMAAAQALRSPGEFLGFPVGADGKLARWDKIVEYMRMADRESDRVLFQEVGKTTNGNPFGLVVISSPSNLANIDRLKAVNRRLFDPRTIGSEDEAASLIREARIFVLVTCSIHATEVGAAQMSMEAVHRLATDNSERTRAILDNVVFLLVPSLNPDGQIMVTNWYNKNAGTKHENAPLPWLYHPYTGHDNNRDAYMFTQIETKLIGKILYQDWLPEVWLDEHQMGSSGPRIFVMPAADPINPNVDPLIYRNVGLLGYAQGAALEKAGKSGIIHGDMYTYWWEGAMAWSGWWHNMLGLLTEVASVRVASPIEQQKADPEHPHGVAPEDKAKVVQDEGGLLPPPADTQFRAGYPRPWLGGRWTLRDIVDYELIATFGLLEAAARLRVPLLEDLYTIGKRQVETGKAGNPYAVIIPPDQQDWPTATRLLQTLAAGGVEIHRADRDFTAAGKPYPAGTHVILMGQPFRAYAKDILEPQVYPQISPAPGVPPRPPYDVAGWSLGMQMGVDTLFVDKPFEADLAKPDRIALAPGRIIGKGSVYLLSHEANNSLVAVNRLLKAGCEVSWLRERIHAAGADFAPGAIVVRGGRNLQSAMAGITRDLGVDAYAVDALEAGRAFRLRLPRTAIYQPWGGSIDEGWTRWLLEQNEFAFTIIHPEDVRKGDLSAFDAVIFPDMTLEQIIGGITAPNMPPEFKGGIDSSGTKALRSFIERGGTIITLGRSSMLAIDNFSAPFRDALRGIRREDFFCPGSILRVMADTSHPIAYGMKDETTAYFADSLVLEPVPSFSTMQSSIIVRYPNNRLLKSGWLQGESYLSNKVGVAEVRLGKGRMVLIPLRVQHRAQTYATFKLLFNAILTSATDPASWSSP